jgi:hypothetical protein
MPLPTNRHDEDYTRAREPRLVPEIRLLVSTKAAIKNVDRQFLQMMIDRLIFAHYRYEIVKSPTARNFLKRLEDKLRKYKKTKNRELLLDVANYAAREFRFPSMEGTYFEPEESHGRNRKD